MSIDPTPPTPEVVDRAAWQVAIDELRIREKAHTREGDAIAAARRRLPMVEMDPTIRRFVIVRLLPLVESCPGVTTPWPRSAVPDGIPSTEGATLSDAEAVAFARACVGGRCPPAPPPDSDRTAPPATLGPSTWRRAGRRPVSTTALDSTARPDRFAGELVVPGDPSYDEARTVFNAMVDRRPAVIARCTGPADVSAAIGLARARGLEIAVRGGGHGVAGTALAEGGLVVDLSRMRTVTVNPQARTATVAGGATMADLDRTTQPHGLATTGGRVSTTGVAGLTLGGGNGWLDRRFGLACDNLLAADLVTAEGTVVRADQSQNPELFWALHGGGGNFGVATSLTFRLHPLSTVTVAKLLWPAAAAPEIARAFRAVMESAPDELSGALGFLTAPPAEVVPPHLAGRLACAVVLIYTGTGAAARATLAPLLGLGHEGGLVAEVPYADFQCMNEDPPGHRNHWSAEHLAALPDDAIDAFCAHAADLIVPSPSTQMLIPQGGAMARGPADYPIPWRQAPWHAAHFAMWTDAADDERARAGARGLRTGMAPWSSGEVYLNFIGDEGPDRVVAGLGAANLERLAAVKATYDPENLFHLNHNIAPATAT